jgi:hypothetical protein
VKLEPRHDFSLLPNPARRAEEFPIASGEQLEDTICSLMRQSREDERTPLSEDYLPEHIVGELTPLSAPIRLVDYDCTWSNRFQVEAERIRTALGERSLGIEHVGSSSVVDLPAKPIIDIVLVVAESAYAATRSAGW